MERVARKKEGMIGLGMPTNGPECDMVVETGSRCTSSSDVLSLPTLLPTPRKHRKIHTWHTCDAESEQPPIHAALRQSGQSSG